ncbi:hypothetical protein V495_04564 [Pseudogymnoascus sp. VKM F-4514 (FW-929)]|nr:hypothetical protein V495_04564 [Pseudogymnoascus sp. VKM F-4514 (FW-929)]
MDLVSLDGRSKSSRPPSETDGSGSGSGRSGKAEEAGANGEAIHYDGGARRETTQSEGWRERAGEEALRPLEGWRLGGVTTALLLGLFLATLETSITATALVSIGEDFEATTTTTWVVISYLLSYMGFAVIFARISDGIGRKGASILAWVLFAAFSLGAGLATSINQLIAFRTIQGIGGSGLFSLSMIVLPQITPVRLWALMSSLVGMSFAFSYVLGPILGGVITHNSTWRWIYLFNAPAAVLGVGLILIAWPAQADRKNRLSTSIAQMDVLGALLLLIASVLLVFALQQAGSQEFAWNSPVIVATLTVSSVSWAAFVAWIAWLESGRSGLRIKAIFPLSIALKRPTGPAILSSLIVGFPFFMILINLPIRFQVVNNDSSVMAGIHTLPFLGGVALGTTLGGGIATRKNLTAHALIFATALTCLGSGLLSTMGVGLRIPRAQYGYQVILGTGFGLAFTSITMMNALAHDFDTVAAAQGAVGQARVLGGSISLAIGTIILNKHLVTLLTHPSSLSVSQLASLRASLAVLPRLSQEQQEAVRAAYASAFREQMRVCAFVLVGGVVVTAMTWQRVPRSVEESRERQARLAEMQKGGGEGGAA